MSRADLLLSVLQDGEPHSRRDIQQRVGYFLTNNAASELRRRGLNVVHRRQGRVDTYQLLPQDSPSLNPAGLPSAPPAGLSEEDPTAVGAIDIPARRSLEQSHASSLSPVQLSIEEAA